MISGVMREGVLRHVFAMFCLLPVLDVIVLCSSSGYRDLFGVTHGLSDNWWRLIPDAAMVILYWRVYSKMQKASISPHLMLWHGILYGLLGLALFIPWGGYFLAPLTPIGLLYLGAIVCVPSVGYYLALGVATLFVGFNAYLVIAAGQRLLEKQRVTV